MTEQATTQVEDVDLAWDMAHAEKPFMDMHIDAVNLGYDDVADSMLERANEASDQVYFDQTGLEFDHSTHEAEALHEGVAHDDEKLVRLLMYPDSRISILYQELIGDEEGDPWDPEKQAIAQAGVVELIAVQYAPNELPGDTIETARGVINWVNGSDDDHARTLREAYDKAGRGLHYQSHRSHQELQDDGDFLHFGVNYKYRSEPDVMPYMQRIYVTPKMEYVGHVAAQIVAMAREQGFEPYGKIRDESTNTEQPNMREDRLLFYVRTDSARQIIMEAIEKFQTEHADMFEDEPPLLTQKTALKGVGVAEEPHREEGGIVESYNEARESLIREAWKATMRTIVGEGHEMVRGNNGRILDGGLVQLREDIEAGNRDIQEVIDQFRIETRKLAPKYNVDPDNLTRNKAAKE